MKLYAIFGIFVFSIAATLRADTNSKAVLVAQIMHAYGVEETIEVTRIQMMKQATKAMTDSIDQIKDSLPQLSEEGWSKIHQAADKYMKNALTGWDGASLTKIYAKAYEDNYSVEELSALSKYLKTKGASKSIRIEKLAAKSMNEAIMSALTSSMQPAMRTFVSDLQTIVKEEIKKLKEKTPNQALEPTTPAVTIPAAQEVAPAGVVAHL